MPFCWTRSKKFTPMILKRPLFTTNENTPVIFQLVLFLDQNCRKSRIILFSIITFIICFSSSLHRTTQRRTWRNWSRNRLLELGKHRFTICTRNTIRVRDKIPEIPRKSNHDTLSGSNVENAERIKTEYTVLDWDYGIHNRWYWTGRSCHTNNTQRT